MRHVLCVSLFFLSVILLSGQNITVKETIHWDTSSIIRKDIDYQGNTIYYLYFSEAVYHNVSTRLPYFGGLIELNNNIHDVTVTLSEQQFETLDNKFLKNIDHTDSLTEAINVQHDIVYIRKQPYLQYSLIPLKKNGATVEKLTAFSLIIRPKPTPALKSAYKRVKAYKNQSVLNTGSWYKIKIEESGIYKLSWSDIKDIGISNPANVKIYGNKGGMLSFYNDDKKPDDLSEIPVLMDKGSDGVFNKGDHILFYGDGPDTWEYSEGDDFFKQNIHCYSDGTYYFVTEKSGAAKTPYPASSVSQSATHNVNSFNGYAYHETDQENLIKSGREFYEKIGVTGNRSFSFSFPGIVTTSPAKISSRVLARSSASSTFYIYINGQNEQTISLPNVADLEGHTHARVSSMISDFIPGDPGININVVFDHNNNPSAEAWLDYVTVNARRQLKLIDKQLLFRDIESAGAGNISAFTLSGANNNTLVWDVSDPVNIRQIQTGLSGSTLSFKLSTDTLREFIAFDKTKNYPVPVYEEGLFTGPVENQNLHGAGQPEMVIVSHPDFLEQAKELEDIHKKDGLDVLTVTPEQVYNEFSSGAPDVSAIRNFMKMLYDRAENDDEMPKYLLLFGDGSYDNKTYDKDNTNYILTYQTQHSVNSAISYVTDDFFGLLDNNEGGTTGVLDIGIGRFPVKSTEEAQGIIEKIKIYKSAETFGDWRNKLLFVGDDDDGNIHMRDADRLANFVDTAYPGFSIDKIFIDAYKQESTPVGQRYPEVNRQINDQMFKGALIFNYLGHGGEVGLAHERIVTANDIMSWENKNKLPLFVTATCEFSRFDDYKRTSAGELILLNSKGGGIGLLTTTRVVYSGSNYTLNRQFFNYAFNTDANNEKYRLGDIIRLTKRNAGSSTNKRKFVLLGDPALKINNPFYKVNTTSVNKVDVDNPLDTLSALAKISVTGQVVSHNNELMDNFNGVVYPVVYDKNQTVETLANDKGTPYTFKARNSVLYKGKASVSGGKFEYNFVVPKDIVYRYGKGKFGYYADNNTIDAHGSFKDIIIGGAADSVPVDNDGPKIRLFMNDTNFASGGITDNNPKILALVYDDNGINTTGNGIGHDITAMLNDDDKYILNDYYEGDMDSYQSGTINYPLTGLDKGEHRLKLKVWDVYNNSSEEVIDFVVVGTEGLVLDHILNYPNPFTTRTSFFFEHNQPGTTLDVMIQIFTVSGKLVKTIQRTPAPGGYRAGPFEWDGKDDFGSNIGRGVYIYRVKVRNENGETAEEYQKLVILK
jgi:hypothetical protein